MAEEFTLNMLMDTPIKVCLAADRKYLRHLLVTMSSILLHAAEKERFEFLILSDGSLRDAHFSKVGGLGDCEIQIVRADQMIHEHMDLVCNPQWPFSVYYRLLLPFLCSGDERIIYLDCDIIVRSSLAPLWNISLEESVAGVADAGFDHLRRLGEKGIEIAGPYINSGVMVWNLERIRSMNYSAQLKKVKKRLPNPDFPDQDWINIMFETEKQILSPVWNCMSHLFSPEADLFAPYTEEEVSISRGNPRICHFTNIKPWTMTYNEHPYWFEYWEVLRSTPYAWLYPKGRAKKILFSSEDSFFLKKVRPVVKRLTGRA
ncbi:glycosyltransferase family 8 protein [Pontiella sulfatireligans]|uniref:General stress protein A n=1 Tax=Pontiella sulfatireligans TaxID=2750658 RepID=A0A6C2UNC0_9BACT|nr:glycosyltransferase family 8 protein [Pontiella sulfatireligans]VGO21678.1 General stress protein A [Pontiella sulfatireligans]